MSMKTFNLPDLGEGLQEAEIVSWHVAVGDRVVTDQPLVSVETDKAVVEVPAPRSGRIARLAGEPGDRIQVGEPLVEFDDGDRDDAGTVVGKIDADAAPAPAEAATVSAGKVKIRATPAVRAKARKLGVDLAMVQPTGPDGAVMAKDVERGAKALAEAGPATPLRGVRRAMAEKMTLAHSQVVPASVSDEADVDAWGPDTNVMLRLIQAVAAGCKAAPIANAWFDDTSMALRIRDKIDLGIAVNTDDGLFVPVLRDIAGRGDDDLLAGLERLKADVKARHVPLEELRGQTITLSNFGTLVGRYSAMVVMPPQVIILGAGRIAPRVVAVDGAPAVRRMMPLSVTFDHRALTGGEAGAFLAAVMTDLATAT